MRTPGGSGTTALVCLETGRRFIGGDLNPPATHGRAGAPKGHPGAGGVGVRARRHTEPTFARCDLRKERHPDGATDNVDDRWPAVVTATGIVQARCGRSRSADGQADPCKMWRLSSPVDERGVRTWKPCSGCGTTAEPVGLEALTGFPPAREPPPPQA